MTLKSWLKQLLKTRMEKYKHDAKFKLGED